MEQVLVAVQSLHGQQADPIARQEALRWLERFQNSIDAWNVSMSILSAKETNGAERFFAAQTLKHKIVADFVQLDEATMGFLRQTLLESVLGDGQEGRQVVQQLILALAALAVQCPPSIWSSPVADFLAKLTATSTQEKQTLIHLRVLGVLACIPEQMENSLISSSMSGAKLSQQRKRLLDENVDQIITLIGGLLSGKNSASTSEVREQLLGCLLSWIKYGAAVNPQLVGSPSLLQSMLATLREDLIHESSTLETSSEILCELFFRLFQSDQVPSQEYLSVLFGGLLAILPSLSSSGDSDTTPETILAVGRVYLEAGEAFLPLILENAQAMQVILEAALLLAQYRGDLKVVEATFNFWSALESRLSEANEATRDPFLSVFAKLFHTLVTAHLAFPLDEGSLTLEERDAFRDFRHVIGDCLKDCTRMMGSTAALLLVKDLLAKELHVGPWQRVEAALFALRTISSSVDRRESEALPDIFRHLLGLTPEQCHPKLVYAIILNIGCYAEWTRYHGEFVAPFLSYLIAGFREHAAAASLALKYLCQSCEALLTGYEASLRSLYAQCTCALGTWMTERDMMEVSEAIANVLSILPEEQLASLLPQYLSPWLTLLPRPVALDNLAMFIELIGADGEAPSATMNGFLLQLLAALAAIPKSSIVASDGSTAESLTMLLKTVIVRHHHGVMAADLVDLLVSLYVDGGVAGALYALRYVVISEPKILTWHRLEVVLQSIIIHSTTTTTAVVGADFFHLITAVIDFYEEVISMEVDYLLKVLGLVRSTLSSSPINPTDVTGAMILLLHLFQRLCSTSHPVPASLGTGLSASLTGCVQAALQGSINIYPAPLHSDVAALLRKYHAYSTTQWHALLTALLEALPETLFVGREKEAWMGRFETAATSSRPREMKETLVAFIGACRRRL